MELSFTSPLIDFENDSPLGGDGGALEKVVDSLH